MMMVLAESDNIFQVIFYLIIFGGIIVAEIVKYLKRKKLEEQYLASRRKEDKANANEKANEAEGNVPYPQQPPPKPTVTEAAKEIFEELFEGETPEPTIEEEHPLEIEERKEAAIEEPKEEPKSQKRQLEVSSTPQNPTPPVITRVAQENHQKEILINTIFSNPSLSEIQKVVVFSEIMGPPKAVLDLGLKYPITRTK